MRVCAVYGCTNKYSYPSKTKSSFTLFSFPKDKKLKEKWLKALKWKNWKPNNNSRVCSAHFEEQYLSRNNNVCLKSFAVPTIFETFPKYLQNETQKKSKSAQEIDNETSIPCLDVKNSLNNHTVLGDMISLNENIASNSDNETEYEFPDSDIEDLFSSLTQEKLNYKKALETSTFIEKNIDNFTPLTSITHINNSLKYLANKIKTQSVKIKTLKQSDRRRDVRIKEMQETVAERKDKDDFKIFLDSPSCTIQRDIVLRQISKLKNESVSNNYPEDIKSFAIKLHSHSFEAYQYMQEAFNSCLPHPQLVLDWKISNDNCEKKK